MDYNVKNNLDYQLYQNVKRGNCDKVIEFLKEGADINYNNGETVYGYSPIHMASYFADMKNDEATDREWM